MLGGEFYEGDSSLHYELVEKTYKQYLKYDVEFIFGQAGNVFIKDVKTYHIDYAKQIEQALKSGIQYRKNSN